MRRQLHRDVEITEDRADVESMILAGEKTKEKLNGEKEKLDFEEQLRELDDVISGKADIGCNVQWVPKALILKSEKEVTVNREGNKESDLSTPVLGVRLLSSGLHVVMGYMEDLDGPAETKNLMDQGEESLLFQHWAYDVRCKSKESY